MRDRARLALAARAVPLVREPHDPPARSTRDRQELRPRAGPARRVLLGLRRRGDRARRGQRRRQVDARQVHRRHLPDRLGRDAVRGQAGAGERPARRGRARHRDRLPGPGALRQPGHRPEHVPGPGTAPRHHARRGRDGGTGAGDADRPVGPHRQVDPAAGLQPFRRAAPDRRHRQGRAVEQQGRHPRRAHRRGWQLPGLSGSRTGAYAGRHGPGRRAHLPQHERRVRGVRPDSGPLPRQDGRPGPHRRRDSRAGRRTDHIRPQRRPGDHAMNKVKEHPGDTVAAERKSPSIGVSVRAYAERVRGGDMGALPAVLGLIVLCTVFSIARPAFLTPINFANLFTQGAAITVIAMGLVFVLLVGEIDLSAGFASGVCAAVLAVTLTNLGLPWYVCVLAAILTGVVIGIVLGVLVAKVGIPSFVVTLAAFLAFQGLVLVLVREGTNISIRDDVIVAIATRNLPPWLGWVLFAACVAAYAGIQLFRARKRAARGLTADAMSLIVARVGALAVIGGLAVWVLNLERSRNPVLTSLTGVPIVVPIILVLLVFW